MNVAEVKMFLFLRLSFYFDVYSFVHSLHLKLHSSDTSDMTAIHGVKWCHWAQNRADILET